MRLTLEPLKCKICSKVLDPHRWNICWLCEARNRPFPDELLTEEAESPTTRT